LVDVLDRGPIGCASVADSQWYETALPEAVRTTRSGDAPEVDVAVAATVGGAATVAPG